MATIYILEDDLNIQEIEAYALKNSGYQTEGFDNAREFFKKVSERVPSLCCWILCFLMRMDWTF